MADPDPEKRNVHRFESHADLGNVHELDKLSTPSSFLCPDCGGGLWELKTGTPRFRCRVGHGYSLDELMASQNAQVEVALWAATRSLEDRAVLNRRLAEQWQERGSSDVVEHFLRKSEESEQHAAVLRRLLGVEPEPQTEAP